VAERGLTRTVLAVAVGLGLLDHRPGAHMPKLELSAETRALAAYLESLQ
jgi:hypothetical protein